MYIAKVACFCSSPGLPSGRLFKAGSLVPDEFVQPGTPPTILEKVTDEKAAELTRADSPAEVPMSLGQLGEQLASTKEDGTLPGREFKKPVTKRASDKSIV